jgi:hypothetical protein
MLSIYLYNDWFNNLNEVFYSMWLRYFQEPHNLQIQICANFYSLFEYNYPLGHWQKQAEA